MTRSISINNMVLVRGFGTLVAIFETCLQAQLVANKFKGRRAKIYKNCVAIPFMNKELAELRSAVERTHPKTTKKYSSYQELTVTIELPHDLSLKTTPLVLDLETANFMKDLKKTCGKPRITYKRNFDVWHFIYSGRRIYWKCRNDKFMFNAHPYTVKAKINVLFECI